MVKSKKHLNKIKLIKLTIVTLCAVTLVFIIWSLVRNDSFYSTNKEQAKSKIDATITNISLPSSPAYTDISDDGCDGRNSTGLARMVHCEIVGQIYYRSSGDIKNEINLLNRALHREGWSASNYTNASESQVERSRAALKGEMSGSILYKTGDKHESLVMYVESFDRSKKTAYNAWIKMLIEEGKLPRISDDGHIYGIKITKTYWTCESDSLFKLPCPQPPSQPK